MGKLNEKIRSLRVQGGIWPCHGETVRSEGAYVFSRAP